LKADRDRTHGAEQLLKDRDDLVAHAKDMWMKENSHASKLADTLAKLEDQIADRESRIQEMTQRYADAGQEARELRLLVEGADGRGFASSDFLAPAEAHGTHLKCDHFRAGARRFVDHTERFKHLLVVNDSVLLEDEILQIGMKSDYQGCDGELAIYFGNKSTSPLQGFSVMFLVKDETALRLTAAPIQPQLEPHDQIVQRLTASCFEPFTEPPIMRIQFLLPDASPRRIQIRLPVVLTKFMHGREVDQREFFNTWRLQHFVVNEVTNMVNICPRLAAHPIHIARSLLFGGALRLHHGFDKDDQNFVLVGQLHERPHALHRADVEEAGLGKIEQRELGLTLVRIELGVGRFKGKARIVVRSSHRTVGAVLTNLITTVLAVAGHLEEDRGKK